MDLAKLGQIAGIAGIAVGAAVLIFRSLIESALPGVPPRDRGRAVTTIALFACGIGLAGIAAWTFAGSQSTSIVTRGDQSPGVVGGRDVSIGVGQGPAGSTPPASTTPTTASPAPTAPPANTRIDTSGAQAPGVAAGGDVRIQMDGTVRPPSTRPSSQ